MNNWIFCGVGAFFVLLNTFYFLTRRKREQYEHRWSKESKRQKRLGTLLSWLYYSTRKENGAVVTVDENEKLVSELYY